MYRKRDLSGAAVKVDVRGTQRLQRTGSEKKNKNGRKSMFQIGCHLSASKGFLHMGKEAVALGGNTFQFYKKPRGGAAKAIDEKDVESFKAFAKKTVSM